MTRVVITGLGAVTPVGNSTEDFWNGIFNGEVGIAPITKFDATETGVTVAGEVKDFDPSARVGKRESRKMDLFSQYAVHAAGEALNKLIWLMALIIEPFWCHYGNWYRWFNNYRATSY